MRPLGHLAALGAWYSRAKAAGAPDRFAPPAGSTFRAIVAAIRNGTLPEDAREYVADLLLFLNGSTETAFMRPSPPPPRRGPKRKSWSDENERARNVLEIAHATRKYRRGKGGRDFWLLEIVHRLADERDEHMSPTLVKNILAETNFEDTLEGGTPPRFDKNGRLLGVPTWHKRKYFKRRQVITPKSAK